MSRNIAAAVIVLIVLIGVAYLAFFQPTGFVLLPAADTGGNGGSGGDGGADPAPPSGGDGDGAVTPPAPSYTVNSFQAAKAKVVADSTLQNAWDDGSLGPGTATIICGGEYKTVEAGITQIVELDLANGTANFMVSEGEANYDRWHNTLNNFEKSLGMDVAFVSALRAGEGSVVAEYGNLLKGASSKFADLSVSEKCGGCSKVYAVHMFCQKARPLGWTLPVRLNAIVFVDADTGNVYS